MSIGIYVGMQDAKIVTRGRCDVTLITMCFCIHWVSSRQQRVARKLGFDLRSRVRDHFYCD